jgi:hypothetical protein
MGSYNIKSIKRKAVKSSGFSRAAQNKVTGNLAKAKKRMISEFDNHAITREIASGANGSNISKTLNGYGNLFSFIGFSNGSDPLNKVRNLLISIPRIKSRKSRSGRVDFIISMPKIEDFRMVASMPWESGRSWVEGVETGISGFGYYMANLFGQKSRSGTAVQSENKIRTGSHRPMPYITPIIQKFIYGLARVK